MAIASSSPASRRFSGWLSVDPQHASAVVRVVSAARLLFVALGLSVLLFAPPQPIVFRSGLIAMLATTLVLGVVVLLASHRFPLTVARYAPLLHVWDVAWVGLLVAFTDGAHSHFLGFFAFPLLASAFRWRLGATIATSAVVLLIIPVELLVHEWWQLRATVDLPGLVLPVASLVLGTVLVLWLAEKEWKQRLRSITAARIIGGVTVEAGFVASVRLVLGALMELSGAERAVLAFETIDRSRVFLWRLDGPPGRVSLRLSEEPAADRTRYMFPVPPAARAIRWRRHRGRLRLLLLDREGMSFASRERVGQPLLDTPFDWVTALCLLDTIGGEWRIRLFIFDPVRRSGRGYLWFLRSVLSQTAPALFNVYLLRRTQSRSGSAERRTLVRAMHDGTLQSVIAAGLELELLRRDAGELSERTRSRLARVQNLLNDQVIEVRDLIQSLKQIDIDPERFLDHVEDLVRRFRDSTAIAVSFDCRVDGVHLPPRTCRELAAVVQEALVNVRKHARASTVQVLVSQSDDAWRLAISDDGKGFDFEGRLGDEELSARRCGPAMIRNRVKGIGGRVLVESRPGRGSTIDITVPSRPQ